MTAIKTLRLREKISRLMWFSHCQSGFSLIKRLAFRHIRSVFSTAALLSIRFFSPLLNSAPSGSLSYLFISRVWFIFVYICLHYFLLPRLPFIFYFIYSCFLCQGTLNLWLRQKKTCGNLLFRNSSFSRERLPRKNSRIEIKSLAVNSQRFSQIFLGESTLFTLWKLFLASLLFLSLFQQ